VDHVSVQAEADYLLSQSPEGSASGLVGAAEVDWEVAQGLHVRPIGSWCDADFTDDVAGTPTAWLGLQWFAAPRVDVRVDALHGTYACVAGASDPRFMGLAQLHVYL
jgi:hypothetical protein